MIIRGNSPPLLPSSHATVISKNDNERNIIEYSWIEKTVDFLTLKYVKISIKAPVFAKDIPKETNTFNTFFKLIIVYRNTRAPS